MNSLEDLINLYSFYFFEECNIVFREIKFNFFIFVVIFNFKGWFNDRFVYLIYFWKNFLEIGLFGFKSDLVYLEI